MIYERNVLKEDLNANTDPWMSIKDTFLEISQNSFSKRISILYVVSFRFQISDFSCNEIMGKKMQFVLNSLKIGTGPLHIVMIGLDGSGKTTILHRTKLD